MSSAINAVELLYISIILRTLFYKTRAQFFGDKMTTKVLLIAALMVPYCISLLGWGRAIQALTCVRTVWPLTLAHGLAIVIFIGGLVNLLGIAYAGTLDVIVILGIIFAAIFLGLEIKSNTDKQINFIPPNKMLRLWAAPSLIIVIIFAFIAATQVPSDVFNYHDDFEKYLAFPVRMLATGTLQGGIFNALGGETLGAQAFLQGFVIAHWPVDRVNSVDGLFALVLCLLIITVAAWKAGAPTWLLPLMPALVFVINPMYANVSSLYTGSVLIMALMVMPWNVRRSSLALPVGIVGVIYAALVALKTTFLLSVVIHFIATLVGIVWSTRRLRPAIYWGAQTGILSLLFVSPWLGMYLTLWRNFKIDTEALKNEAEGTVSDSQLSATIDWLFLGDKLIGAGLICALLAFFLWRYGKNSKEIALSLIPFIIISIPIFSFIIIKTILGEWFSHNQGLRLINPFIIAGVPAMIAALFLVHSRKGAKISNGPRLKAIVTAVVILIMAIPMPSAVSRVGQIASFGSGHLFPDYATHQDYRKYNRYVLSQSARAYVKSLQDKTLEGSSLLVWILFPFHMDFSRNQVFDVQPAGLGAPWASFPFDQEAESISSYLKNMGISYVIWQHTGFAVRSNKQLKQHMLPINGWYDRNNAHVTLRSKQALENLSKISEVIYDDKFVIIFRINQKGQHIK